MSNVKLICEKSFSEADMEIIDSFIDFQNALIDGDIDKINEIVLENDEFINLVAKQSKKEFIDYVENETLKFSISEILDPTILFDDDNSASMIAKVRLTLKINDKELRLITDSVVSFQKVDSKWHVAKWEI